jgi:hypothetical protein
MSLNRVLLCLVTFVLCQAQVRSQTPPDFSGTWTRVGAAQTLGTPGLEYVEPAVQEITYVGASIHLKRRWPDGSVEHGVIADGAIREGEQFRGRRANWRAWWDGPKLLLEWTHRAQAGRTETTVTTREARWIEGGRMVLEITWTRGGDALTRRATYQRD